MAESEVETESEDITPPKMVLLTLPNVCEVGKHIGTVMVHTKGY